MYCTAAEEEIKQSSHGLKCSALFTRPSTNRQGVDKNHRAQEGLKEVGALDGLRGSEENEQGKQNVRALEEETSENRSWETGGREVRGEQDKTRDHLHKSSLTISECC